MLRGANLRNSVTSKGRAAGSNSSRHRNHILFIDFVNRAPSRDWPLSLDRVLNSRASAGARDLDEMVFLRQEHDFKKTEP